MIFPFLEKRYPRRLTEPEKRHPRRLTEPEKRYPRRFLESEKRHPRRLWLTGKSTFRKSQESSLPK
ncbi:MAG: hypothetical protein M0R67_08245 [Candidatus Cloacimonas sp.]|nr:hypothetical protein [Candidatus Cloacimonas sp.]